MRSAETGGKGLVHVATSPHLARVSGRHFTLAGTALTRQAGCTRAPDQCGQGAPPPGLENATATDSLWEETHAALSPWLVEA